MNMLEFNEKDDNNRMLKIIEGMEKGLYEGGIEIVNSEAEKLWKNFQNNYKLIEAAGGVVKKGNAILAIYRLGKWDLPKGKMEKGESREESAIREVEEECGISKLKIVRELPSIYHTYTLKDQRILKVTYWFEMSTTFSGKLVPQTEENITEVKWVEDVNEILENTYPSIGEMVRGLTFD